MPLLHAMVSVSDVLRESHQAVGCLLSRCCGKKSTGAYNTSTSAHLGTHILGHRWCVCCDWELASVDS